VRAPETSEIAERQPAEVSERQFDFFGCTFRVTAGSAAALALLDRLYGCYASHIGAASVRFSVEDCAGSGRPDWRLHTDEGLSWLFPSLRETLQELEYQVCQRVIDGSSTSVVLHGATVCGPRGSAFIAGQSEAGKTTLALALAARGYAVMSDDIALLDPVSGALRAVPRCFHLDDRSRRLLRRAGLRLPALAKQHGFVTPADVNRQLMRDVAVRHIIALDSGRGSLPTLSPLPQAAMVASLSVEAGWANLSPARAISALSRMTGGAQCWKLRGGKLQPTTAKVAALLSHAQRPLECYAV